MTPYARRPHGIPPAGQVQRRLSIATQAIASQTGDAGSRRNGTTATASRPYQRVWVTDSPIHEGGTGNHVESARVLAERIPNAELVLVEGGRHGYLREMPEKGHPPILDFLRRH